MKYFKLKFLLLFAALAVAIPSAWAGNLTVADGDEISDKIPLNGYDYDNCNKNQQIQMIYPSSMLTSMEGATITKLIFHTSSGVQFENGKINVSIGTTLESSFADDPTAITGLTSVITGMSVSQTSGEWELELSTPYTYNGGNLVIEFAQTEDGGWGDTYFFGQNQSTNASFYGAYSAVYLTTQYTATKFLPKVTFVYNGGGGGDEPTPTGCEAIIVFKDGSDSSTEFGDDLDNFKASIDAGGDYVSSVTSHNVYQGETGIKFSSSKKNGSLTFGLANLDNGSWLSSKITVNAKRYGNDVASMSVNGSEAVTLTDEFVDYEFPLAEGTTLTSITIDATKRIYVKSITIEHECGGGDEPTLQDVVLSFPQNAYTATLGETFAAPMLTVTPSAAASEVVYSSSDPTVATVANDGTITLIAAGTTTITASISDSETYEDATAYYVLTVEEAVQPGSDEYVLVTNINQLQEGKKILILNANSKNLYAEAMGRQQSNNRKTTTVQVSEDKVTSPVADTEILILEKEGDYWLFKTTKWPEGGLGYLYAAGANSNNYLRTEVNADNKAQATVTIARDGEATVVFNITGDNPRNILRHNSSSSLYACYGNNASDQKPVYFYVEKSNEPVVEDPLSVALTAAPEVPYTVGDNVTVYATVENGSESTMVTYKINDGEEQDYTEAGIILPNTAAGDVVVTVYALDGDNEATATATYHFNAAEAFAITLTPDGSEDYTVGDKVNVKVGVENNIANCTITYSIDRAVETYDPEKGIDIPNDKAGDVTLTVNVTDGFDHQGASSTTATYHFNAAPAIEVTLTPAGGNYFLDEQVTVTVTTENTIGDAMITYQIGDGEEQLYEDGITITAQEAGTVNLTVTVADGYHEGVATATGEYIFTERPVAAAPEFSLVSGSYGTAQSLEITSADGATIYYTTDGTEPTTASTQYTSAIELGEGETIIKAIAVKEGMTNSAVANAYYIIDIPEVLPTITAFKGYYQIKNNGNSKYANIAGRKTMNFTGAPESAPGTVIWLETNDKGQVQSLRSQGADLQGYAERAMRYVPTMVKLVVDKLHAEGAGEILGENGYDEIMAKFDSCFDYHLYVEQVGGSWRIYGKTPSMQPVVDFYREHTHQVETKLPDLEGFINKVLKKLRDRIGGESIFTDFSVRQIWENMNVTLTEPVDSASTMTFYREVLNNKNYVWDFAYQTAQIYWNNVKHHPRYDEFIRGNLGEYADYLDEFVNQIHPDFKYYIIQRGDEPDYISEGNKEIRDGEAHTLWTIEDRPDFTVNIAGDQFGCPYGGGIGGYATTLYTDFAYTLPNEVTAYKVTAVKNGVATLAALSGIIPAQTPVLLIADAQGDYTLTLSTTAGTKVTGNLLCGVDSLITRFQLKTPMLVTLFNAVQGIVGDDLYNEYVQPYEYLQLLYAGTVNNKYFWGLTQSDANLCVYMGDDDMEHCVFRNLDGGAFVDNGVAPKANKAFLVSEKDAAIRIASKGDVNHDGKIDIADVTTLISRVLKGSGSACEYCGDMDSDGSLTIADVTTLINLCLRQSIVLVPDNEGN